MQRRVLILGSTGSIGTQAIEVVRASPHLRVVGLAARTNSMLLAEQARELGVACVALADEHAPLPEMPGCVRVLRGASAAEELVSSVECDVVLAAMVGSAGLAPVLRAIELGRDIALANKETLVAGGSLVTAAARARGVRILPVDSEHAALWQCLRGQTTPDAPPCACDASVSRVLLTASGGPFRAWSQDRIERATPHEALQHPTWRMGSKVSIDSATLINKALELIEAHWLFGLPHDRLGALVHPQSIVHAIVEHADGSVLAQLADPDMRLPIERALRWPRCEAGVSRRLDWQTLRALTFEPPDATRFPGLLLAERVLREGGTSGCVMSAANEEAVGAFLRGSLRFGEIPRVVARVMDDVRPRPADSLASIALAEQTARERARSLLG